MIAEVSLYNPYRYKLADVKNVEIDRMSGFIGRIVASEVDSKELALGMMIGFTAYLPDMPIEMPCSQNTPIWLYLCEETEEGINVTESLGKGFLKAPEHWRL